MDNHSETEAAGPGPGSSATAVATASTTTTASTVATASSLLPTTATTITTAKVGSWSLNKSKVKKLGIKSSLLQALTKLKTATAAGTNLLICVSSYFATN